MAPVTRALSFAFVLLCATPVAADRIITVEPGLWEYTHSLTIPGVLAPTDTPKTECIKPDEAQRSLSELLGKLSGGAGCTISKLKDTLNTVKFDLACKPAIDGVTITSKGQAAFRYGRTKITGDATGIVSINGAEMAVAGTGKAQRVGRCKK